MHAFYSWLLNIKNKRSKLNFMNDSWVPLLYALIVKEISSLGYLLR